jgi:hypothetical protein
MKKPKIIILFFLAFISFYTNAQDISKQEQLLPIDAKTNCYVRYYYFPNLEAYFDNLEKVYHYKQNGKWLIASELPQNYGGYSLYNKVKVSIVDYDGDKPYEMLANHKKKYPYNSKGRFANTTASTE